MALERDPMGAYTSAYGRALDHAEESLPGVLAAAARLVQEARVPGVTSEANQRAVVTALRSLVTADYVFTVLASGENFPEGTDPGDVLSEAMIFAQAPRERGGAALGFLAVEQHRRDHGRSTQDAVEALHVRVHGHTAGACCE